MKARLVTTYVLRVYGVRPGRPRRVVGLVEPVDGGGRRAFRGRDDLWAIVASPRTRAGGRRSRQLLEKEFPRGPDGLGSRRELP